MTCRRAPRSMGPSARQTAASPRTPRDCAFPVSRSPLSQPAWFSSALSASVSRLLLERDAQTDLASIAWDARAQSRPPPRRCFGPDWGQRTLHELAKSYSSRMALVRAAGSCARPSSVT
eukprot:2399088-Pyramimonas_sp.AAC.2